MRRLIAIIVLTTWCLGCPGVTSPDAKTTTYTGTFSTQYIESSTNVGGITQNCQNTYNLTGTVTIVLRGAAGNIVDGTGAVNAQENWVSVSGAGCTPGPSRSTTSDWTTDLAGSPTQFNFTVQRSGTGTFVINTSYAFSGLLAGNTITGNLQFAQGGSGTSGGNVQSTSNGSASVGVTLH